MRAIPCRSLPDPCLSFTIFQKGLAEWPKINMNELKESIDILVKTLYIRDDSSFIFLDDLLTEKTGVFYYFLLRNTSSSKRYLKTLIVDSMKSLFGNQVVEDGTRGKRRGFYVDSKYNLEGSSYITPSNSNSFSDPEKLKLYISGSKVRKIFSSDKIII